MTTFSPRIPRLEHPRASRVYGGAQTLGRPGSPAAWSAFAAVAACALAFLMWRGAGNTFFRDEWSWILGPRSGLNWTLAAYNQHLLVVPKAVWELLFGSVGISQYWPYRLLAALAHLACVAAIFAYALRRLGAMALLIAIPIAVFGAGAEFILMGVNFGFTASVALAVAALLWLDRGDRRGDLIACVLLVLGLLFSELALLFAAGVAVELTWRDRSLRRAWVWGIPAALYAAWWVAYRPTALTGHDYRATPAFVARLAVHAAGGLVGLGAGGGSAVLVMIVFALAFLVFRRRALNPRLVGLGATLLIFWGLVAFNRAQHEYPGASRYVYTGSLLLVLILVEAFRGVDRGPGTVLTVAVLSAVSLVGSLHAFGPEEAWVHTGSRTVAAELGALDLARSTAPPRLVLDPVYGPQVIAGPYFSAVRDLRSTPADSSSQILRRPAPMRAAADVVLVRAGAIQVGYAPAGTLLAQTPPSVQSAARGRAVVLGGCVRLSPARPGSPFDLGLPPSGLELRPLAPRGVPGAATAVSVRRFARGYENPPVAVLRGGAPLLVRAVGDSDPQWQIRLSSESPVEACGVR